MRVSKTLATMSFLVLLAAPAYAHRKGLAAPMYDPAKMTSVAATLAADTNTYGQDADLTTHCNEFVREWFRRVTGTASPDLNGLANEQYNNMSKDTARWSDITNAQDWNATYAAAATAAKGGDIVLAAWRIESPTKTDHGHIAAVLPLDVQTGYAGNQQINNGKGLQVPMITEASTIDRDCTVTGVDAKVRLSCGFGPDKQPKIHFFKYMP